MLLNTLLIIKPKWRGENVVGPDLKIDNTYPISNRICLGDKVTCKLVYTFNHSSISNQGFIIFEIDVPTLKTRSGSDNFVLDEQVINDPERRSLDIAQN